MEETIFIIFLIMSISFIFFGFAKRQYLMIIIGGSLMAILGALFLAGIYYQSGNLINVINSTLYNVTKEYSVYERTFTSYYGVEFDWSEVWGLLLIVIGAGMTMIAIFSNNNEKKNRTRMMRDDDEEE